MPSHKLLNGVAHDIMDHAMSGLSCLHPHLTQTCRSARVADVTLDLMHESPLPSTIPQYQPLVLASQSLHQTFVAILAKIGFTLADVSSATLTFHVSPDALDDYSFVSCASELVSSRGKSYRHEMPPWNTTVGWHAWQRYGGDNLSRP
jgi:hypothetical protein